MVLLGCLALTAYFIHHAVAGKHGLEARTALIERSKQVDREMASLEAVRNRLRRDVDLLSPAEPHRDLVEEIAASTLAMAYPGESVLLDRTPTLPSLR